jgi:hypothetical protein
LVNQGGQGNTFLHAQWIKAPNIKNSAATGEDVKAERYVASAQTNTLTHEPIFALLAPAALCVTTNLQSLPTAQESRGPLPPNARFSKQFATIPMKSWKNFEYVAQTQQHSHNHNHPT